VDFQSPAKIVLLFLEINPRDKVAIKPVQSQTLPVPSDPADTLFAFHTRYAVSSAPLGNIFLPVCAVFVV
jgi:hypothetical protein